MESISENLLNALGEEFTARLRRGERPSITEYSHRYLGNQAAEVEEFLDSIAMLENMKQEGAASEKKPQTLPETFGRYQIQRSLGEGGMGAVYLAHDSQLDRKVALKTPKFDRDLEPTLMSRFYREARSAATLQHPNICPVYDVGEIDGIHYISMAYIEGRPLADLIQSDKAPSVISVVKIVRKVALALQDAHSNGLIHRDLKPANIMIDRRNEPIVMDFGLARQFGDGTSNVSHAQLSIISGKKATKFEARLTMDGTVVGSPGYMAPEQLIGDQAKIGPASDIYALGVLFYELLTGQLPFPGDGSLASIVNSVMADDPPLASMIRPQVDANVVAVCHKAISRDLERRHESMQAFAVALTKVLKANEERSSGSQTADAVSPEDALDSPELVRTKEQYELSKSLYQEGQFAAAVSILEKMVDTSDQPNQFTTWANKQLPKARAKAETSSQPSQHGQPNEAGLVDDHNLANDRRKEAGNSLDLLNEQPSRTKKRKSARRNERLVIAAICVAAVIFAGLVVQEFVGREATKSSSASPATAAIQAADTEEFIGEQETLPNNQDAAATTDLEPGNRLKGGVRTPAFERLWRLDRNEDGKLSRNEIPMERFQTSEPLKNLAKNFDEHDRSPKDGSLDEFELRRLIRSFDRPAGGRRRRPNP